MNEIHGILFLKVLLTTIFALMTARIDQAHIKQGVVLDKQARFIQRFAAIALGSIGLLHVGYLFLALSLWFWLLFNPTLNYLRKLPFWYLSNKGIDKILNKYKWLYKVIYFASLGLFVFCIIKLCNE